jgi:hypothetical protein
MAEPIRTWPELRAFALALGLLRVEDGVSWSNPTLKAHDKLWCWWSPNLDAAVVKGTMEEREALRAADPETFPHHDHYARHGLILVGAGRIERNWAAARLRRRWEEAAPKRWLVRWRDSLA